MTGPSLDVFSSSSSDKGATWSSAATKLTDVMSNPNCEQFDDRHGAVRRRLPVGELVGSTGFAAWTDWRNTVAGTDPREAASDDNDGADVVQSRTFDSTTGTWSGDQSPHAGGLDQDIYGARLP